MILPATYASALLLTIVSMLCLGSWASTFKLSKKWRFELFYFDFALGVFVTAVIAGLTYGRLGDELTIEDNLLITAGKRQIAYALIAGGIFNLANMLMMAAISIAGMAVAFPISLGLALVFGVGWSYFLKPAGNPLLLFGSALLILLAIAADAFAYRAHAKRKTSAKGLILSFVGGILMGSFYPLLEMSRTPEIGLSPYAGALVFSTGVLMTTLMFNLYFMNLPVEGEPLPFSAYFAPKSARNHLLGFLGGILWSAGAIASVVAASAPPEVRVEPALSFALIQGATLIAALWGLLVWKEFTGALPRVKLLLAAMLLLFISGLTLAAYSIAM